MTGEIDSASSAAIRPGLGRKPWVMLTLGLLAQTATSMLTSTPAFLIPQLHAHGVPLATAGLLASTTTVGMVIALVAWGALADRIGERWVLSGGLALAAVAAGAAAATSASFVWLSVFLVIGGIASASSSPASGRLVTGWFPKNRRGLAMGIRQGSQPLGVALAALIVPPLAAGPGIVAALLASVIFCGVLAIVGALVLRDPARPVLAATDARPANPYRGDSTLLRIHLVSILLVIPQFTISIFGFVWLVEAQHVPVTLAGIIVGVAQLIGAVGRIGCARGSREHAADEPGRLVRRADPGWRACDRRRDHHRRRQRARVRRRRRNRRSVLVWSRARGAKHGPVDRRLARRTACRLADRGGRISAHLCRGGRLRARRGAARAQLW